MPYLLDCYINYYYQHKSCCLKQFVFHSATDAKENSFLKKIFLEPANANITGITPPPYLTGIYTLTQFFDLWQFSFHLTGAAEARISA